MEKINKDSFPYCFDNNVCKACRGKCCRGFGGYVWISIEELEKMSIARNMSVSLFTKQYVRQVNDRFSLQERIINGEHLCCFFDPIDCQCTMYHDRPKQCRDFPFWEQLKTDPQKLSLECPGIIFKE